MRIIELDLTVERLEQRRMLAGNVTMELRNGDLRINGDSEDNRLMLHTSVFGDVTLYGLDGTTINGENDFTTEGASDDIRIDLKSGNNVLAGVRVYAPDDLTIRGRGEETAIVFQQIEAGDDITVRTGRGADTIATLELDAGGKTAIRTGAGADEVIANFVYGEELDVRTNAGADTVAFTSFRTPTKLKISAGADDDSIFVLDPTNSMRIDGGRGIDQGGGPGGDLRSIEEQGVGGFVYVVHVDATFDLSSFNASTESQPTLGVILGGGNFTYHAEIENGVTDLDLDGPDHPFMALGISATTTRLHSGGEFQYP